MKLFLSLKVETAPIVIIIVFFIAFFWPVVFSGMCFVAADSLVYLYPMREAAWTIIRDGSLPLWTPHIMSGFPLLAMTQLGIGYPLTWGYLFLPGHIAEEVYVLAPYLLSPAFVYAYLRTVNCSRLGSLLGGLSFSYGGMMMSGLGRCGPFTNAVMWLPLMLIAIERARSGRFLLCLAGAGAAYAMSVLTGLGQMFGYVGLIAAGYGAFLSLAPRDEFAVPSEGGNSRLSRLYRLRPLAVGVGGVAIGAGVGAFQIFETMQAHRLSHRREMTYETFSDGAFAPLKLWQSFINPIYVNHYEVSAYVAPLAVVFGVVAVVAAARSSEQRLRVCFWLLVAGLGLLLIIGDHTPLYRLLYQIPVIKEFRHPWRHAYEWTLGASMLAGLGWDVAGRYFAGEPNGREVKTSWRWRADLIGVLLLASCVTAVVVLVWRAGWPVRAWVAALPTGVVALGKLAHTALLLVAVWWGWRMMRPAGRGALLATAIILACFWEQHLWAAGWWFPRNRLRSDFAKVSGPSRFLEGREPVEGRIYTSLSPWGSPDFRRYEPHNLPARHGFHNAAGYEPLALERYCRVFGGCVYYVTPIFGVKMFSEAPDPQILDPRWQGLDLLNVRFVIQANLQQGLPAHWRKVYDQDDMQVYENPQALPRVWMVPRAEVVSAEESLRRIRGESRHSFNPRETALVELDGESPSDLPEGEFKTPAEARIVSYEANRLAIETVADKSAVLVASEVNYPGWEARIDGQPAEILTTDYLLRGVIVPEGRHRVEMSYTAPAARRGAIISALTLLALASVIILGRRNGSGVQTQLTSNDEINP